MRFSSLALSLALLGACLSGCPTTPVRPGDAGSAIPCTNDVECDDSIACTREVCGAGGLCEYTPLDARCTVAGETCQIGVGCTSDVRCTSTADCDDGIDCTLDSCALGGLCRNDPEASLCSGATPFCDPSVGCTAGGDAGPGGCTSAAECDDSVACTIDSCGVTGTCSNVAMDALCGTGMMCNPTTGCFTPMPCDVDADCDDDVFCNGRERCMPEFGCVPPMAAATCDDSEACTVDRCDATADMCVFECNTAMMAACSTHPACAMPTATCEGRFRLTAVDPSVLTQSCASGMVDFDFSEVTFTNVGPGLALTVTPLRNIGGDLSDNTAPVCPMIDASAGVTGMCPERYILRGMFTDEMTFTGTFQFDGGGGICDLLSGCRTAVTNVTGVRIP